MHHHNVMYIPNMQDFSETYNSNGYARDAVMALALALHETYENSSLNLSLGMALETVKFNSTSVS